MRRLLWSTAIAGALAIGAAAPASATHIHAIELDSGAQEGSCIVLALNGNERDIVNPAWPAGRPNHPLHANFHAGAPTSQGALTVSAKDTLAEFTGVGAPCDALVNVRD